MEWIVTAIAGGIIYWWFFLRQGNLSFWRLAAKHPDEAYEFFMRENCWFVDEVPSGVKREDVTGPFKLIVPALGRSISIYALAGQYEDSQEKFRRQFK